MSAFVSCVGELSEQSRAYRIPLVVDVTAHSVVEKLGQYSTPQLEVPVGWGR